MAKFEQQLDELARMQAKVDEVLESQQKGMTQLQPDHGQVVIDPGTCDSGVMMVNEDAQGRGQGTGEGAV